MSYTGHEKDDSWYDMLKEAFSESGDNFEDMITTLTDEELHEMFDGGYGSPNGVPFTAWGEKYVYFPGCYDGSEWVDWVPRNPCDIATGHIGSW